MAKSREAERAAVRRAAEDGSSIAESVLHDMAEEDGFNDREVIRKGDWILILTVSLYHVGRVVAATDEWIVLDKKNEVVVRTGPLNEFFSGRCPEYEVMPGYSRIRRGCITNVTDWPLGMSLTEKNAGV